MRRIFDPFEELRRMQERLSRMFEEFEVPYYSPTMPVDVIDEKDEIRVIADLPGFDKNEIEVYVEDGTLVIKATRKEEIEEKKKNYIRQERRFGETYRRISLPVDVDVERIKAKYNNGILEVILPKAEKERRVVKIE
ncbi:MAG: Hsp20/alpha crystallin family protein [Archaeoglobus sp.]|nr:Hsp20/alpha crystallin family protein [Archaeoglobus sp.]